MKQSVVITGITGLLGQYLGRYLARSFNVVGVSQSAVPRSGDFQFVSIDLSVKNSARELFAELKPEFVIHTAGLTSVDACEENPDLALRLNAEMTENVLSSLNPARTRFVHISTDHLFSGESTNYSETSSPEPLNVYAHTKLEAEKIVGSFQNSMILRTNFYGGSTSKKKSFSNWLHDELKLKHTLHAFDDVYFTPISVCSLAENIEKLMQSELTGIYNVVGSERITKYEFACRLAKKFDLDERLIVRSKVADLKLKAPRPRDMSLTISKIKRDFPDFVEETIDQGLEKIREKHLV